MKLAKIITAVIVFASAVTAYNTLFIISQTEQALVLQFGDIKKVIKDPGLNWKVPFVQNVKRFDNRILDLDPPEFEVLLTDKKRINVDAYARYKISDPLKFYERVKEESNLRFVFGKSMNAALRRVIATVSLVELLSSARTDSMEKISAELAVQAKSLGVEIIDVRIGRTNLPQTTAQAVYKRMRTEREREANEARAEGAENAQKIRSKADRDAVIILATAEKKSKILRGEGEARRNAILAKAYGRDISFFKFYKAMQNYSRTFDGSGATTFVITPNSEFFKYLKKTN